MDSINENIRHHAESSKNSSAVAIDARAYFSEAAFSLPKAQDYYDGNNGYELPPAEQIFPPSPLPQSLPPPPASSSLYSLPSSAPFPVFYQSTKCDFGQSSCVDDDDDDDDDNNNNNDNQPKLQKDTPPLIYVLHHCNKNSSFHRHHQRRRRGEEAEEKRGERIHNNKISMTNREQNASPVPISPSFFRSSSSSSKENRSEKTWERLPTMCLILI